MNSMNIKEVKKNCIEMSYGIIGKSRSSYIYCDDNIMCLMKKKRIYTD